MRKLDAPPRCHERERACVHDARVVKARDIGVRSARGIGAALLERMMFETIDQDVLVTVAGGIAETPSQQPMQEEPQRTWQQMGREYVGACINGAGQSMIFGGKPRSVRDAATTAAIGCAMGVGMKAVDDAASFVTGTGR
jgi:hypothetical protein